MKKVVRLTESDLIKLIKKIIKEEESGADPTNDFSIVEKGLTLAKYIPIKKDTSKLEVMGVEDLIIDLPSEDGKDYVIVVRYYNPTHPKNNEKKYVVELIVNGVSKKKWGKGVNMYEVIKETEYYYAMLDDVWISQIVKNNFKKLSKGMKRGGAFEYYYKAFKNMESNTNFKDTQEEMENKIKIVDKMLESMLADKNLTEDETDALENIGLNVVLRLMNLEHRKYKKVNEFKTSKI